MKKLKAVVSMVLSAMAFSSCAMAQTWQSQVKMNSDYTIVDFDKIAPSNGIALTTNLWASSVQYTNEVPYVNVAEAIDALFSGGGPGAPTNWAAYPASQTVDMDSKNITNAASIYGNAGIMVDLNSQILYDFSGSNSLAWGNRTTYDTDGEFSIDWTSRYLYDSAGNMVTVDWANRFLVDENGFTAVDWNNRYLYDTGGGILLDFTSEASFSNDINAVVSSGASTNWAAYPASQNVDMNLNNITNVYIVYGTNGTVDLFYARLLNNNHVETLSWQSCYLSEGTGSVLSIDWASRCLYDATGMNVLLDFSSESAFSNSINAVVGGSGDASAWSEYPATTNVTFDGSNTFDIGSAASPPRHLYVGSNIYLNAATIYSSVLDNYLGITANGQWALGSDQGNGFIWTVAGTNLNFTNWEGIYFDYANLNEVDTLSVDHIVVSQDILPATSNAVDIGSAAFPFRHLYIGSNIYLNAASFISSALDNSFSLTANGQWAIGSDQGNGFIGTLAGTNLNFTQWSRVFFDNSDLDQIDTITVDDIAINTSIYPASSNAIDLGSASLPFRHLYLGTNSIYIGGTKAIGYNKLYTTAGTNVLDFSSVSTFAASINTVVQDASSTPQVGALYRIATTLDNYLFFKPTGAFEISFSNGVHATSKRWDFLVDVIKGTNSVTWGSNIVGEGDVVWGTTNTTSLVLSKPISNAVWQVRQLLSAD